MLKNFTSNGSNCILEHTMIETNSIGVLRSTQEMAFRDPRGRELIFGRINNKPVAAVITEKDNVVTVGDILQPTGTLVVIDRTVESYARMHGFMRSPIGDGQLAEIYQYVQDRRQSLRVHVGNILALNTGPFRDLCVARVVDGSVRRRGKLLGRGIGLSQFESGLFGLNFARRISLNIYADSAEMLRSLTSMVGVGIDYNPYLIHLEEALAAEDGQQTQRSAEIMNERFGVSISSYVEWMNTFRTAGNKAGTFFVQPELDPVGIRGILTNIAGQVRAARPRRKYFEAIEEFFVS